jgi:hypothetical protein
MPFIPSLPLTPQPINHAMMQHESRILRRSKQILQRRADTEMTTAVDAQDSLGVGGPVVHDGLEVDDIG